MEVLRAAQDKIAPFVEETLENLNNLSFEAVNDKLAEFDLPSVDILGIQIGIATILALLPVLSVLVYKQFFSKRRIEIYVPVPLEADPSWKPIEYASDGEVFDKEHHDRIICFDPTSMGVLGTVMVHTTEDVELLVAKCHEAQKEWKRTSFAKRRAVLKDLNKFILDNQDDIINVVSRDTGKTYVDAFFGEILTTLEKVNWLVNYGEKYLQPEYRETGSLTMHKSARVEYVPRGVVGAIVSWNYPFHNILGPIVAAIFAGNGIVVKPSEYCAWSTSKYFEKIVDTLLAKHGVNTSLVQFVYGGPEVGQCLIASDIAKITFIGSPQVGAKVMTAASLHIKPVVLELGGKDAAIICEDVDLNQVVPIIMRGVFQNSGQNCVGLERIIVHEKIYEDLIERVVPLVKNLRQGSPLAGQVDVGAMTMVKNAQVLVAFIEHAAAAGARLLVGGKIAKDEHNGQYFEPTVIVDVDPKSYLFRQESFAPIMTICRFRSDQEAVDLVNSTQYGLGGSVFCNNIARAEKIAKNLDVGMVNVNDFGVNYLCQSLPFGGVKKSGFGRFAGVEGLRDECVVRAVTTDKLSWMKTTIPGPLNYPLGKSSKDFCKGLGKFGYGQSISDRVSGIVDLVKASMAPKK